MSSSFIRCIRGACLFLGQALTVVRALLLVVCFFPSNTRAVGEVVVAEESGFVARLIGYWYGPVGPIDVRSEGLKCFETFAAHHFLALSNATLDEGYLRKVQAGFAVAHVHCGAFFGTPSRSLTREHCKSAESEVGRIVAHVAKLTYQCDNRADQLEADKAILEAKLARREIQWRPLLCAALIAYVLTFGVVYWGTQEERCYRVAIADAAGVVAVLQLPCWIFVDYACSQGLWFDIVRCVAAIMFYFQFSAGSRRGIYLYNARKARKARSAPNGVNQRRRDFMDGVEAAYTKFFCAGRRDTTPLIIASDDDVSESTSRSVTGRSL